MPNPPAPDDATIHRLAEIAHVPAQKWAVFGGFILSALEEARRSPGPKTIIPDDGETLPHLDHLRGTLIALNKELGVLLPNEDRKIAREEIHNRLAAAIKSDSIDTLLSSLQAQIHRLLLAVDRAAFHATQVPTAKSRRKKTRGIKTRSGPFDVFVSRIVVPTIFLGGKLTCDLMLETKIAKGSFVAMLELLREYLPEGFIPKSDRAVIDAFRRAKQSAH
jgi:hypothetical protein